MKKSEIERFGCGAGDGMYDDNRNGYWVRFEDVETYAKQKVLEALEIINTLTKNNVTVTNEHIQNLIKNYKK